MQFLLVIEPSGALRMQTKNLIIALSGLSMLAFATPSHGENWVYVTEEKITPDDTMYPIYTQKFYIDIDSKVISENRVRIWQKIDYPDRKDDEGMPYLQDLVRYFLFEYDCYERTRRLLRYDSFSGILPRGSYEWREGFERTEKVIERSTNDKIFRAVCEIDFAK